MAVGWSRGTDAARRRRRDSLNAAVIRNGAMSERMDTLLILFSLFFLFSAAACQ